ncbi:MAG: hypothetical protein KGN84_18370, partial [Acidobacteriota bacterium]|nr:hypothetical protein [Acidobacteriota bacterium]
MFFRTDETHIRSIAFDRKGNLIAGTEPGGLVIRITPKGEGFVVYQMAKREVTAIAAGPKNEIYAAAVGTKSALKPVLMTPPAPPQPPPAVVTSGSTTAIAITPEVASAPVPGARPMPAATVPGGSDVFVIPESDEPSKVWSSAQDVVYALAFDASGRLLIGAGNRGTLYRVDDRSLYQTLVSFPVEQVTNLLAEKDGTIYAATGNIGKVFRVGPGLETEGTIESDVFDSGGFTRWGRIEAGGTLNGGSIALAARSGNLDRPQNNWSAWSPAVGGIEGGPAGAPAARFLQFRATLRAGANGASPWLDSVDTAYLRANVPPKIEQVEITPYNYRFPAPVAQLTLSSSATLTLPAIGARTAAPHVSTEANTYPGMTYQKGAAGVRWTSSDENGDSLVYRVEIRGSNEKNWKPLRDTIHEKYTSFDSTAFADGEYRLRITASDAPSNTPADALSTTEESDPFIIDNTPPAITGLSASGGDVRWHAADALSTIYKAEYSVDGGEWTVVQPEGRLSDSKTLDYRLTLKDLKAGEHTIAVRVSDD